MTPSISAPVRQMSGGNVQKVLVGREIAQSPKVLLVAFPTRGVDVNTSHVIYGLLNEQKQKGWQLSVLLRIWTLFWNSVTGLQSSAAAKSAVWLMEDLPPRKESDFL